MALLSAIINKLSNDLYMLVGYIAITLWNFAVNQLVMYIPTWFHLSIALYTTCYYLSCGCSKESEKGRK